MLEEIALDKARIARNAYGEWAGSSTNWLQIIDQPDGPWPDLEDLVMVWLGKHLSKAMGMTEAELTRAVKRYLTSWAQGLLRRPAPQPEEASWPIPVVWDGMVDDLIIAGRMAREKAGKKNLDPWVPPRRAVSVGGETVDYTSHEFWSDMYMYAIENPERVGESHTAFLRRMGDAGANAKALSERMPQPHNKTKRAYSMSASHDGAVAADADGKFDADYQTIYRPSELDNRPRDLREDTKVIYPVVVRKMDRAALVEHRAHAKRRFATEPMRG